MENNSAFNGWAVVELFGHAKEVGYVTTQYFGTACMFQVDVPELPEREAKLDRPQWIGNKLAPIGTEVKREKVQGRTRLVGPAAIYSLNPCTEDMARATLERMIPRDMAIVRLPEGLQLEAAAGGDDSEDPEDESEEMIFGRNGRIEV